MSRRTVEEGLTSLSYPHVAYRLEGGYGNAGSAVASAAASAASSSGASAAGSAAGGGFSFDPVSAIANAVGGVANAVAAWKTSEEGTKQAELGLKSTKYQADAAKATAKASVAIQNKIFMGQQLAAQTLPVKITAGLVVMLLAGTFIKKLRE